MKTMLVCLVALVSGAMLLAGCGGGDTAPQLTAEQEKVAKDLKDQLGKAKDSANAAMEAVKDSTDAGVKDAAKAVTDAVKPAQVAVNNLWVQNTDTFETKKAAAEKALKDLAAKVADLAAKAKTGMPKMPPM